MSALVVTTTRYVTDLLISRSLLRTVIPVVAVASVSFDSTASKRLRLLSTLLKNLQLQDPREPCISIYCHCSFVNENTEVGCRLAVYCGCRYTLEVQKLSFITLFKFKASEEREAPEVGYVFVKEGQLKSTFGSETRLDDGHNRISGTV